LTRRKERRALFLRFESAGGRAPLTLVKYIEDLIKAIEQTEPGGEQNKKRTKRVHGA
jgi:hypothetical protein